MLAVLLAFLPVILDMTILHIAVPSLSLALGASATEILWIIDIYPLMMAGLLVPMGSLADRVGHRRMLLTGLMVFGGASLAAAFAPTALLLIGARALLAVGAAMIMPCVLALIRQTFEDDRERGVALGLWSTFAAAGGAMGPLVGGALLEHFWWGSVFLLNVPVMLGVWSFAFAVLPRRVSGGLGSWNIGQALVLIVGLITVVYAIKAAFKADNAPLLTGLCFLVGVFLLAWFARKQVCSRSPMLDLSLFTRPAIAAGMVMAIVVSGALAGAELTIAQELQFVVGLSPLQAGMFILPLMIASGVGGPFAGSIAAAIGLRPVAVVSLLVAAASLAGLGLSDFQSGHWSIVALLALLGFVLGIGLTASSIAIMDSAPASKAGAAGALEGTGYELGAGLGITVFGVLLAASYQSAIEVPQELVERMGPAPFASIGETIAAAALAGEEGAALIQSANAAFVSAHATVLLSAAGTIALVAAVVMAALRTVPSARRDRLAS
ncbi:MFS transporter [Pararhodospirillum oryzae]|uniref:MFS transporter n=1 Tax=Pararhodospirillum oryzae TaxID=478448 RepID=A0A512H5P5_9PROT|nr:MFS transporter [Pararhodospirillum oryzae]